jgi:hypothetical protein
MYDIHTYILVMRISRIIRYKLGVSVPRRPLQQHLRYQHLHLYLHLYLHLQHQSLHTLFNHIFSTSNTPSLHFTLPPPGHVYPDARDPRGVMDRASAPGGFIYLPWAPAALLTTPTFTMSTLPLTSEVGSVLTDLLRPLERPCIGRTTSVRCCNVVKYLTTDNHHHEGLTVLLYSIRFVSHIKPS